MPTNSPASSAQSLFHEQSLIYGQSLKEMLSLALVAEGLDGEKEGADPQQVYQQWLENNELKSRVCFLDITFGPVRDRIRNSALKTIVLAPSTGSLDAYRQVLKGFFENDYSLAAHPVFRKGLPVFCLRADESRSTGTPARHEADTFVRPETDDELETQLSGLNKNCDLYDDGMLYSLFEREDCPSLAGDEASSDVRFESRLFRTFTNYDLSERSTQSLQTIGFLWQEFTRLLDQQRKQLLSGRRRTLGTAYAAPIGVRDPGNPRHFSWIADVYVGFDCETGPEEAYRFLRQLFLHLMRTNSALKTREDTQQYVLRTFGHEIKRVTRIISEAWAVSPSHLLNLEPGSARPGEKIGSLRLHPDYSFLLEDSQLLIVPFGRLLRAAQQTIDLWSWQNGRYDLPKTIDAADATPLGRLPLTWPELLRHAWKIARDQRIMNNLSGNSALTPEAILGTRGQLESELRSFDGQAPQLMAPLPQKMQGDIFLWRVTDLDRRNEEAARIDASFSMVRVLIAWFANCVQHGDRNVPIGVRLKTIASRSPNMKFKSRYNLTIVNAIGSHTAPPSNMPVASKLSSSMHGVRVALEELNGLVDNEGPIGGNQYQLECQFSWTPHL
jgi:hypothetical protein